MCEHRRVDRALDRAEQRRENRRRRHTKRIVSFIALMFIIPMFVMLAPMDIGPIGQVSAAESTWYNLTCEADTFVSNYTGQEDTNFGTSTAIQMYSAPGGDATKINIGWFRWDLSGITPGTVFANAYLLYYAGAVQVSPTYTDWSDTDRVDWGELTITYNNMPGIGTKVLDTTETVVGYYNATSAAFLTLIQAQFDDNSTAYLSGQAQNQETSEGIYVRSREYPTSPSRIRLVLEVAGEDPQITNEPVTTATEDVYYEWNATCTAADSGSNDWDFSTNATFLSLTGETELNVTIGGTPVYADVGSYWVNVTVNDTDSSDFENYTLNVTTWRWAPTFTTSPATTGLNNTLYSYDCDVNESATFDLEGNGTSFLSIDAQGWVNGTPTAIGWYYVNISATSTAGTLTAWQNYTLTILVCEQYILRPNSDEFIEWDQNPASTNHWEKVDDPAEGGDGAVTYVYTSAPLEYDRWGLTDLPEASPCLGYDMSFWVIARNTASGESNISYGVYIGTTYYELSYFAPTTDYANYSVWQNISPATGVEWTFAEINAMQFYVYGADASPTIRVTQAAVYLVFHDAIAPVAVIQHGYKSVYGPTIDTDINFTYSETGIGLWFSQSYSYDNLAIVNWTWNITINEELFDTYYGGNFGYRYVTVGDYIFNLTLRDAYGNLGWDEHSFTLNRTQILRPDDDSDDPYPGELTGDYADIQDAWYLDEVALHDENASYIYTPDTVSRYSFFTMDDFTGNHALETYNVTLFVWALETGPDSTLSIGLRNGTSNYWGLNGQALTETYVNYSYEWVVCPWTGLEWTTDDINATIIGIGFLDANPGGRVTKAGIFVTVYPPDLEPPVADAGPDQVVNYRTTVTFDGSGSTDNIAVVNWTWTFTYNGTAQTLYGVAPTFFFWNVGTYTVTLNASDDYGNWDTDEMTVTAVSAEPYISTNAVMGGLAILGILGMILVPLIFIGLSAGDDGEEKLYSFCLVIIFEGVFFGVFWMGIFTLSGG